MSGSERWKQKWIAAIFLCGWLLFSFCESIASYAAGMANEAVILLQMFIAVINEVGSATMRPVSTTADLGRTSLSQKNRSARSRLKHLSESLNPLLRTSAGSTGSTHIV